MVRTRFRPEHAAQKRSDFRRWNIEALLPRIRCPLLAVKGTDDEYGTMAQIDGILAAIPSAKVLKLSNRGHSPHRDQPEKPLREAMRFLTTGNTVF